ncbi:hypothetical protein KAFR_0H03230 [Kazachstania africana CBS 2517]|uniref:tRNA wybutosine-synthesizing protein 2 n=1 Tax=Kazachstania africana (strain ATCC 22294 / BCRC 22015 / CBS 2517 / CECT 1963 / NBRC 1671 / NRRL Y-8276) TaxID=1071382 RepID=H2AZH7_KAZAF|nr:hypothetical protein KAFR_0H03230 [Kazachstania africana CBS 2517]CCF59733.1 hypothetical protein KAFR_0H03230 [Kazachstania africana CBS 2517]
MPLEIVVNDARDIKKTKTRLEEEGLFVKPIYRDGELSIIKTKIESQDILEGMFPRMKFRHYLLDGKSNESNNMEEPRDILTFTKNYFRTTLTDEDMETLLDHVPLKYSIYPPILLLNNSEKRSFQNEAFQMILVKNNVNVNKFYTELLKFLRVKFIFANKPILNQDVLRQPHNLVRLFSLDDSVRDESIWCELKQNGIWQVWNPCFTMFSRGNVKEKKRVLDTFEDIKGNDVVDLYCGIGYFSFSYLKRGCRYFFGFDLNQWSINGFHKGLQLNKLDKGSSCYVFQETNEMSLSRIAHFRETQNNNALLRIRHINLGLLPSSKQGWPVALNLISQHHDWESCPKVTLHIHENVHSEAINDNSFARSTVQTLQTLNALYQYTDTHLERIKTFAPDVWHVCLDIDVSLSA